MSLNSNDLPASGGKDFTPMDAGTYPARIVNMVDLGMQGQRPYQGKEKPPVNMISLTYEFVDEFMQDEDGNDLTDKPRWLTEMMPIYSLGAEKAKSTLRYLALDPKSVHKGDFSKIVDVPCQVTVIHNPNKKVPGKVYENIGGVSLMREKDADKCAPLVNPSIIFDMDAPVMEDFAALPEFIQKKVREGINYEGSILDGMLGGEGAGAGEAKADDAPPLDDGDENPY